MRASVRFYAQLVDLADAAELDVPVGEPRSVKDLIEAQGVPHPEIGLVVVDGQPVSLQHRISGGERVAVYPPLRSLAPPARPDAVAPPVPPRFVADVHLGTLARRLRLLGFDTWYTTDATDRQLARCAAEEHRILLTRDRGLLMRRVIDLGYCPRSPDPDRQLDEVVERYDLGDHLAPGTRCVTCNGRLAPALLDEVADHVPPRTRRAFDTYARCQSCGQVYWPGAHGAALERIVERATQAGDGARPPDERPSGS
jgi:uncharacterized protein